MWQCCSSTTLKNLLFMWRWRMSKALVNSKSSWWTSVSVFFWLLGDTFFIITTEQFATNAQTPLSHLINRVTSMSELTKLWIDGRQISEVFLISRPPQRVGNDIIENFWLLNCKLFHGPWIKGIPDIFKTVFCVCFYGNSFIDVVFEINTLIKWR